MWYGSDTSTTYFLDREMLYGNRCWKNVHFLLEWLFFYGVNIIVTLQNSSSAFILMILINQLQAYEG
jgi:hypothetical protein